MSNTQSTTLTPAQARAQRGKSSQAARALTLSRRQARTDKYGTPSTNVKRAR